MKRTTKVVGAAAITLAALIADPAVAHAEPAWCTLVRMGSASQWMPAQCDGVVGGGFTGGSVQWDPCSDTRMVCVGGNQIAPCNTALSNCSPVPGVPGTWNPNGYTPCLGKYNGCYR